MAGSKEIYGGKDTIYGGKDTIDGGKDTIDGGKDTVYGGKDTVYGGKDTIYGGKDTWDRLPERVVDGAYSTGSRAMKEKRRKAAPHVSNRLQLICTRLYVCTPHIALQNFNSPSRNWTTFTMNALTLFGLKIPGIGSPNASSMARRVLRNRAEQRLVSFRSFRF